MTKASFDPYNGLVIQRGDTDAAKLTVEQLRHIVHWCDAQRSAFFDEVPLDEVLKVYHASIEWVTFEDWLIDDTLAAVRAYNSIVSNKDLHFS